MLGTAFPGPHLHELPVACPEWHVGHTLLDAGVEVKVVLSQEGQGGGVTQEPEGQEGTAGHSRWDGVQHTSGGCEERGWCLSAGSWAMLVSSTLSAGCWQLLLLPLWLTSGCLRLPLLSPAAVGAVGLREHEKVEGGCLVAVGTWWQQERHNTQLREAAQHASARLSTRQASTCFSTLPLAGMSPGGMVLHARGSCSRGRIPSHLCA